MTPTNWTMIANSFDPFDPVPVERLGDWFVDRPNSPRHLLADRLSPDRSPQRYILVGQPSSGKSSELKKLARELQEKDGSLAVLINLHGVLDIDKASPPEVLFLMGAAVVKIASGELPADRQPDQSFLVKLKQGLETIVQTHTENKKFSIDLTKVIEGLVVLGGAALTAAAAPIAVAIPAALAGGKAAQGVVSFLKKVNPFRFVTGLDTKVVRKLEVEPDIESMVETLNLILDDVTAKLQSRTLVLLVDGLDRLRQEDVIKVNFLENKFLNGPRCRVLYVGPLDLYYVPELGSVRSTFQIVAFPHVKLRSRDKPTQTSPEGYQAMREVAHRRLRSLGLNPAEMLDPEALDLMILGTAGVMRDFVRVFQAAAEQVKLTGQGKLGRFHAVKALNELRRQLMAQLTPEYHAVLDQVKKTHERVDGKEGAKCDLLLRNDVVLSYFNDDVWFAPHAALSEKAWE